MTVSLRELLDVIKDQELANEQEILAIPGADEGVKTWVKNAVAEGLLTNWQGNQLLQGKKRFTLGKYQLLEKLADRNRHVRFLAKHRQMDRLVELVVSPTIESDTAKFLANAGRLANIDHPSLQHTFDFEVQGTRSYLVMEHTAGQRIDLTTSQPFHQIVEFAMQIMDGIRYLHDRGFVHGDLDATTFVVDKSKRVRIERVDVVVDERNRAQPFDDIHAVGKVLSAMIASIQSDGSKAQRKFKELVAQMIEIDSLTANGVHERLAKLDVAEYAKKTNGSPVRKRTSSRDSTTEGKKDSNSRRSNSSPTLLVLLLLVGGIVSVGGIGTLLYVLTRSPPRQLVDKPQIDNWWEESEGTESNPEQPIGDEVQEDDVADNDDAKTEPPAMVADVSSGEIDLGKVGVNQATSSHPEVVDTKTDGDDTTSMPNSVANGPSTKDDKPADDPTRTMTAESDIVTSVSSKTETPAPVVVQANVFEELPSRVTLGSSKEDGVQTFGKLPESDVELTLLGGNIAHGKVKFRVVDSEDEKRNTWQVQTVSGTSDFETIANLAMDNGELQFRWSPTLPKYAVANHLRNCLLRLSTGEFQHDIILRGPAVEIPMLTVSCDGPNYQRGVSIPTLPSLDSISFEVVEISGQFVKPAIDPKSAAYGSMISITTQSDQSAAIKFDLTMEQRRGLAPVLSPYLFHESANDWVRLTRREFQSIGIPIIAAKRALPETKKQFEAVRRRLSKSISQQQRDDLKAEHDASLRIVEAAHAKFESTRVLCDALDQKAQVRIRIFYTLDNRQIDLAVSSEFASDEVPTE